MKPKICKYPGCEELPVNFPKSTIKRKYCKEHAILAVLSKARDEASKDKAGLEKMREERKKTPQQRFYQLTAWRNCSQYVLLHYADDDLMVECCTSGRFYRVNDPNLHCGHYHKADRHKATAFEFKNLAPQSASDNTKKGGLPEVMAEWIERVHGPGTLEWLNIEKNKTLHLDKVTLNQISKRYLNLFNEELKRRGIDNPWKNL